MTVLHDVPLTADGDVISEGSVVQHVRDTARGVVTRVIRAGDRGSVFDAVGDIHIKISPGTTRVTSIYKDWKIVPRSKQTYEERYYAWLYGVSFDVDTYASDISKDEALAISGIMALLPNDNAADAWNFDYDYVNYLSDALRHLAMHIDKIKREEPPK